jgi:hypothetical protein
MRIATPSSAAVILSQGNHHHDLVRCFFHAGHEASRNLEGISAIAYRTAIDGEERAFVRMKNENSEDV